MQLRFVVWDGDISLKVLRGVINQFEKEHPGIKVKLENVAYGLYFQKLLSQYAANVAPDVAMLNPEEFQRFAKRGALLPLNDLFPHTPDFKLEDYYEPIVKAHSYHGTLYVLPRDIAPIGIVYYNKRLFQRAGMDLPDGSWTWDFQPRPELGTKCFTNCLEKLTIMGPNGRPKQWGYVPGWTGLMADMFTFTQGARYADNYEDPTKILYNDPRVIKAYQFVSDLANKQHWMPSQVEMSSVVQSTAADMFISEKVAMFQSGIWEVPQIREKLVPGKPGWFDWDICLAPGYKDPATGKIVRAAPTGGSGYAIMSSTAHPKESWLLTQYMAGAPGMLAMARAGIAQPAIRKLALSDAWIPGPNTPLEQQYPHNRLATDEAVPYVVFAPNADCWHELADIVNSKLDLIWTGSAKAKDVMADATSAAQDRLDAIRKQEHLPKFNWSLGGLVGLVLLGGILVWVYLPHRGQKLSRMEKVENRAGYLFASPWILGMLIFTVGPMLLSLVMSFTDWDIIQPARWRGVGNYSEAFLTDSRFWNTLKVTLVYTIFSVPGGLILAMAMALLLNAKVKGIAFYRTCFYIPALASTVAAALIWRKVFQPENGLLNAVIFGADGKGNFLGLASILEPLTQPGQPVNWLGNEKLALPAMIIMSMWTVGGSMVILLAGLQGIPQHYYEAALLDGAGLWAKFKAITLPLVSPALFFSLITGAIGSFQFFTQAFVMTSGGPNDATRFYMIHLYENAFRNLRMGYAASLAWILFAAIFIITLAQFRLNRLVYYEGDK